MSYHCITVAPIDSVKILYLKRITMITTMSQISDDIKSNSLQRSAINKKMDYDFKIHMLLLCKEGLISLCRQSALLVAGGYLWHVQINAKCHGFFQKQLFSHVGILGGGSVSMLILKHFSQISFE